MNLTQYAAAAILNGTPIPATLYIQLHTGNPTNSGTANLAAGIGGTSRRSFTRSTASVGTPGNPVQASNVAQITWLPYNQNELISHGSVWDANSSGNCWFVGALPASVSAAVDDALYFAASTIVLSLDTYS
jgi:hypothetical protein